jgi:hypothetical protein
MATLCNSAQFMQIPFAITFREQPPFLLPPLHDVLFAASTMKLETECEPLFPATKSRHKSLLLNMT